MRSAIVVLIFTIGCCTVPDVSARYRRFYGQGQQTEDSQIQQRPQLQTKPFTYEQETSQTQQRPHVQIQTKPLAVNINQYQQRPQLQTKPFHVSQNQQRPNSNQQSQSSGEDLSDENDLQQTQQAQNNQGLDKYEEGQSQWVQDVETYKQELDKKAESNGHKQPNLQDAKVVSEENKKKPWYIRLKNWGSKKIDQLG